MVSKPPASTPTSESRATLGLNVFRSWRYDPPDRRLFDKKHQDRREAVTAGEFLCIATLEKLRVTSIV